MFFLSFARSLSRSRLVPPLLFLRGGGFNASGYGKENLPKMIRNIKIIGKERGGHLGKGRKITRNLRKKFKQSQTCCVPTDRLCGEREEEEGEEGEGEEGEGEG